MNTVEYIRETLYVRWQVELYFSNPPDVAGERLGVFVREAMEAYDSYQEEITAGVGARRQLARVHTFIDVLIPMYEHGADEENNRSVQTLIHGFVKTLKLLRGNK